MQTDEYQLELGWQGDEGLGVRLIQQVLEGRKTATCGPKSEFTEQELAATMASKGKIEHHPDCCVQVSGKSIDRAVKLTNLSTATDRTGTDASSVQESSSEKAMPIK